MLMHKNHFKKQKYGQSLFAKHSEFQNIDEIFYCGMGRRKNTNLGVFMQYQHTWTILRNKNMGQSLFKKYSKFQKFDEILYCWMTRFRNVKSGVFRKYQKTNYFKKEKYGTESFWETFKISKILIKWFYFDLVKRGKSE